MEESWSNSEIIVQLLHAIDFYFPKWMFFIKLWFHDFFVKYTKIENVEFPVFQGQGQSHS